MCRRMTWSALQSTPSTRGSCKDNHGLQRKDGWSWKWWFHSRRLFYGEWNGKRRRNRATVRHTPQPSSPITHKHSSFSWLIWFSFFILAHAQLPIATLPACLTTKSKSICIKRTTFRTCQSTSRTKINQLSRKNKKCHHSKSNSVILLRNQQNPFNVFKVRLDLRILPVWGGINRLVRKKDSLRMWKPMRKVWLVNNVVFIPNRLRLWRDTKRCV